MPMSARDLLLWQLTMQRALSIDLYVDEGWVRQNDVTSPVRLSLETLLPSSASAVMVCTSMLGSLARILPQNNVSLTMIFGKCCRVEVASCSFSRLLVRWSAMASSRSLRHELATALVDLRVGTVEVCSHLASVACAIEFLSELANLSSHAFMPRMMSAATELSSLLGTANADDWALVFRRELDKGQHSRFLLDASKWMGASWIAWCVNSASTVFDAMLSSVDSSALRCSLTALRINALDPIESVAVGAEVKDNIAGHVFDTSLASLMVGLCTTAVSPVWDGWIESLQHLKITSVVDGRLPWYRCVIVGSQLTLPSAVIDLLRFEPVAEMTFESFLKRYQLLDSFASEEDPEDSCSMAHLFSIRMLHPINAVRVLCSRVGLFCSLESAGKPCDLGFLSVPPQLTVNSASGVVMVHSIDALLVLEQLLARVRDIYSLPLVQAAIRARFAAVRIITPLRRRRWMLASRVVSAFLNAKYSQKIAAGKNAKNQRKTVSSYSANVVTSFPPLSVPVSEMAHIEHMEQKYRGMIAAEEEVQFDAAIAKPCSRKFPTVHVRREERVARDTVTLRERRDFATLLLVQESARREHIIRHEAIDRRSAALRQIHEMLQYVRDEWEPLQRRMIVETEAKDRDVVVDAAPVTNQLDALKQYAVVARQQLVSSLTRAAPVARRMSIANKDASKSTGNQFWHDQETIFSSAFKTMQALIREEAASRAMRGSEHVKERLIVAESVSRDEILRLQRFHFSKLWLHERATVLSQKEKLMRLRLFCLHSLVLEEMCHRWFVVEAQQLDLRLALLHVAGIEFHRILLAAKRWEEVFSDAYASPTRMISNLTQERMVVKQLLDLLSEAEVAEPAQPASSRRVTDNARKAAVPLPTAPRGSWRHSYK